MTGVQTCALPILILHHDGYETLCDGLRAAASRHDAEQDPAVVRIARHSAAWIDGFVTDAMLTGAAEILGKRTVSSAEIGRRGNNKLLLHRFLEAQGFPVFDTQTAESAGEVAAAAAVLRKQGYRRVVVKAQIGASGIGMRKLDASNPELEAVQQHMFYEGPCLVQGWLDDDFDGVRQIGSPSVQMFLDDSASVLPVTWTYDRD